MIAQDKDIRILGFTKRKFGYENGQYVGKAAQIFNGLNQQFSLVGMEMVYESNRIKALRALRTFHPIREDWRKRFRKTDNTPQAFHYRTQVGQQRLQKWQGQYDLIFQLHTMQSPGYEMPYVLTMDGTRLQREKYWPPDAMPKHNLEIWVQLEREVYQNAKFLFPWSEDTRQALIHEYGVTPDRVITVGGGANFVVDELLERPYDAQIALFVGIDFERKGGYTVLQAWEKVIKALPTARLLIVGPKQQLAPSQAGVEWMGRIKDRNYVRSLFEQATVFVMPSFFEPWGQVILEAMGLGTPCIVHNHLGGKDLVQHGKTGFQVEPGDVDSLAEHLITLLGNPQMAKGFGYAGWQRVINYYNWGAVVNRMAPYIRSVVKDNSS